MHINGIYLFCLTFILLRLECTVYLLATYLKKKKVFVCMFCCCLCVCVFYPNRGRETGSMRSTEHFVVSSSFSVQFLLEIELIVIIATGMVLCFGYVAKTVLTTH